MDDTLMLNQALKLYELKQPVSKFIRHNENITYKVTDEDKDYLLRIHKPTEGFMPNKYVNYSHNELIQNEIEIISALKNGTNLSIQTPICGLNGDFVQSVPDNIPVTLLEWVEGEAAQNVTTTSELLFNAGKMIAEMHRFFSSKTEISKNYKRYNLDQTILPMIANDIENAASQCILKPEQSYAILAALNEMRKRFDELDNMQEKHIIHADMGKQNVIVGKNGLLTPIDFSLCGYGHFYMDISMFNGSPVFSREIVEGYKSVRKCDIESRYMEPYVALGIILFISCQYERAKEWDWFSGKIDEWCGEIFCPLVEQKDFVII